MLYTTNEDMTTVFRRYMDINIKYYMLHPPPYEPQGQRSNYQQKWGHIQIQM